MSLKIEEEMNENTFLIFTGIHPSLSLFQENIETEQWIPDEEL